MLVVKNLPANGGDAGSIPGSGTSPEAQQRTPGFLPGDSRGQRSLVAAVHSVAESDVTKVNARAHGPHHVTEDLYFALLSTYQVLYLNDLYFIPKSCLVLFPKHICSPFVCAPFTLGFPAGPGGEEPACHRRW